MGDTLRGGDGNDTLVGDSDTTVAGFGGGAAAAPGTSALAALVDDLTVKSQNDNLYGDGGSNVLEQGNRALLQTGTVKRASVASPSRTGTPATMPVINWGATACPSGVEGSSWTEEFVNGLAGNPNAAIRLKI